MKNPKKKNWYSFKSIKTPPNVKELKYVLDDLAKLTQGLEFRSRSNEFLDKLKEDLKRIDKQEDIIVNADKTKICEQSI